MPTLKQYVESNPKDGVYILANVGGSTPVTLQVSDTAENVLELLGYESPDIVSTKLVWSMFNVGLLYTNRSLSTSDDSDEALTTTSLLNELDENSTLTEKERDEIIDKLKQYDGPDKQEIEPLISHLEGSPSSITASTQTIEKEAGIKLISQWITNPDAVEETRESIDGFDEYAVASIQTFVNHPHLSAPPIWVTDDGVLKYKIKKDDRKRGRDVFVCDYRFHLDYDFTIILSYSDDQYEIGYVSRYGHLIEYENYAGNIGSRINLSGAIEWAIPDERIQIDVEVDEGFYNSTTFREYKGYKLDRSIGTSEIDMAKVRVVKVDRISNSDNPIAEVPGGHHLVLNRGEKGEEYLVEQVSDQKARIVAKVIKD